MNNQKITFKEAIEEIKEEFNLFLKGCGLISEEQIKTEMECNDDFRRVYEANMLAIEALQNYRPQGEWVIDGHHIRCNRCNEYICNTDREGNKIPDNFCPNCGADMKGGAE